MAKLRCILVFLILCLMLCIFSIIYGLNEIENQRQEIAQLGTKIMWMENNDCSMALQQMPPEIQAEFRAINEMIKQRKQK